LQQIGLTVEERKLDAHAFAAWRTGEANSDWAALCDSVPCADHYDPFAISAGPAPAGDLWPGWPDDPAAAQMREAWIDAGDPRTQRAIAGQLQVQVFTTAAFVPLGQWFPTSGWRKTVTGQQKGSFPVFWDVART
jgi:peptide/nickel transport system substrate-binding protein